MWAVMGVVTADSDCRWTVVRVCVTVLHCTVAALFLTRQAVIREGRAADMAACLPSLIVSGLAFRAAPSTNAWSSFSESVFIVGTTIAVVSLVALGRSFAVLPALRTIRTRGPYAVVRHPIYLGESLLVVACAVAAVSMASASILPLHMASIAWRVHKEEQVLSRCSNFAGYCHQVKWRLVPGIW